MSANAFFLKSVFAFVLYAVIAHNVICEECSMSVKNSCSATNSSIVHVLNFYEQDSGVFFNFTQLDAVNDDNLLFSDIDVSTYGSEILKDKLADIIRNETQNRKFPILIFDAIRTKSYKQWIREILESFEIPMIRYDYDVCRHCNHSEITNLESSAGIFVRFLPPSHLMSRVVVAIESEVELENAAVLLSQNINFPNKFWIFENTAVRHIIFKMRNNHIQMPTDVTEMKSIPELLHNFRDSNIFNYFVLDSSENILSILTQVECKYFRENFLWLFIASDRKFNDSREFMDAAKRNVQNCITSKTNVFLALPNKELDDQAFYYDLIRRGSTVARNLKLLTDDSGQNISFYQYFKMHNEDLIYEEYHNTGNYSYEVHQFAEFNKLNQACVFHEALDPAKNVLLNNKSEKCHFKYEPKKIYRVATVVQAPFIFRDEKAPRGYTGYCIDMMDKLAQEIGFDYEVNFEEEQFGYVHENGSWNGVVKLLLDKKVDIGLGAMWITGDREATIDFTIPFYDPTGIAIMMKLIRPNPNPFRFVVVMESTVWFFLIAVFFGTSALMWLFDRYSPYSYQNNLERYRNHREKRLFNLTECLWFCLTSLTPQGGGEAPKAWSAKLVAGTWWLFGFIIVASYTANLAAFFTKTGLERPIESLEDLADQYIIEYAPIADSKEQAFFRRMASIEKKFYQVWKEMTLNDSLTMYERAEYAVWEYPVSLKYTKIWEAMLAASFPRNLSEGIARVRNSTKFRGFALLGDATDIRYLSNKNCDLNIVGEEISKKPYAIAVPQGSPLKTQMDKKLLNLLSTRWLEELKKIWWKEELEQCEVFDTKYDGVRLENILGFFLILLFGIIMATLTLIVEYFWFKRKYSTEPMSVQNTIQSPSENEKFRFQSIIREKLFLRRRPQRHVSADG